jgi:hypothetical protein
MYVSAIAAYTGVGAQSQNVLGAYFPSWMFCAVAALVATALVRWLLVRAGVDRVLPVPVLVYLAMTVSFSLAGWLLWLG